eukprot:15713725-Heterocapsa_arctica.AAC.1
MTLLPPVSGVGPRPDRTDLGPGPSERLASSRTYRDLFPIPEVIVPPAPGPHVCRKNQQVATRTRRRAIVTNEIVH